MLDLQDIPTKIEELEREFNLLYAGSGIRQYVDSNGNQIVAFTDCGNIEERANITSCLTQMIEILYEEQRRLTGHFDPNKCDSRRVRKELGDKLENLGMKVNKVCCKGY